MFHVTENGPKPCTATIIDCPYATAENTHFTNKIDAEKEYQKRLIDTYGPMGNVTHSKRKQKTRQNSFQKKYCTTNNRLPKNVSHPYRRKIVKPLNNHTKRFINKNTQKLNRASIPNQQNIKKLMMTKYWMPNINNNKWR